MSLKAFKETPPWEWPDGMCKRLLDVLRDPESAESERLLAAELAGDFTVINDELADALLAQLERSASSVALRSQAALSLGPILEHAHMEGFDDPDEVPVSERTLRDAQVRLQAVYRDRGAPTLVRRRVLEASVRAPQDWHIEAIRGAYGSDDPTWQLTAVFCMRFVRGFAEQILDALESQNNDVRGEALLAAGNWELDAAWPRVLALVTSESTEKPLRLAAIEALASIRPQKAARVLSELTDSDDEDISEAVFEAIALAEGAAADDDDEYGGSGVLH
ncbi:MAG TPA: HEAT repeat domain-containing protein [Polyangiaceae bacterium]|jgi:hypothetical protein|nr:HEAT repeat domain-containing protein [Polyangiaceae bacterium]